MKKVSHIRKYIGFKHRVKIWRTVYLKNFISGIKMCHLLKANWYYLVDVCSKMLMYLCLSLSKRKYSCHLAISGLQQYFLKRKNYRTVIWAKFAGNWRTGCIVGVIRIQIARDFVENIKQNWQRLLHINVACHLHILFEKSPCAFHYSSLIFLPSVPSSRKYKKTCMDDEKLKWQMTC